MTATGASVRKHPAKEDITERLLAGESPESVSKWLRNKYSRDKRLWLNKMTLQAYRKNFLELEGDVLAEVKKEYREKVSAERERKTVQAVQATESYQIAKGEVIDNLALQVTDMRSRFEEIYLKTNERLSVMECAKGAQHLNDKVIVEYLRLQKDVLKEFFDMERSMREDSTTTIDLDLKRIEVELTAVKTAVREAINEVCPEAWPTVLEKIQEHLEVAAQVNTELDLSNTGGATKINIKV